MSVLDSLSILFWKLESSFLLYYRSGESLMAVIPLVDQLQDNVSDNSIIRVPLFLVRIDGVIYNTGTVVIRV